MRKVYLAGNMKHLSYKEAMAWRKTLMNEIDCRNYGEFTFVCPPVYYNYEKQNHKSEKEIKDYELMQLSECDIMVVSLDRVNESVGTHFEIAMADYMKQSGKHIMVLGLGDPAGVHPWILDSISRIEPNEELLADYIAFYFGV